MVDFAHNFHLLSTSLPFYQRTKNKIWLLLPSILDWHAVLPTGSIWGPAGLDIFGRNWTTWYVREPKGRAWRLWLLGTTYARKVTPISSQRCTLLSRPTDVHWQQWNERTRIYDPSEAGGRNVLVSLICCHFLRKAPWSLQLSFVCSFLHVCGLLVQRSRHITLTVTQPGLAFWHFP